MNKVEMLGQLGGFMGEDNVANYLNFFKTCAALALIRCA